MRKDMNENKLRIEIKSRFGDKVLFAHDQKNNSIKATLEAGIKAGAYLGGAYLSGANLGGIDLSGVYLGNTDLSGADLIGAYLNGTNLGGAILSGAYLSGAYLSGAYLDGANLDGATYGEGVIIGNNPLFILGLTWPVYIFETHIKIGCRIHTKQEWIEFDDTDLAKMEPRALEFWSKWKKHILCMAFEGNK
jgi:uncharacterized protein YjbI with pentapeptide repeats